MQSESARYVSCDNLGTEGRAWSIGGDGTVYPDVILYIFDLSDIFVLVFFFSNLQNRAINHESEE